jgi:hypothetical protein
VEISLVRATNITIHDASICRKDYINPMACGEEIQNNYPQLAFNLKSSRNIRTPK